MPKQETKRSSETMLVRGEDLDRLLSLAGGVIVVSSNQNILSKKIQGLYDDNEFIDVETQAAAKDLSISTSMISSDLHNLVQSIRTVDLKDLGFRFRRLVRNTSRMTGKPISFEIIGDETTIDKSIVEKLYDPIAHQLRNAIDHGIEDIQIRKKNGKNEEGKVTLTICNTEQDTFIEIADDGAGIDMNVLRQKAMTQGLITAGQPFTEELALHVMCSPGLSTAETVSEVSGRGVGMDVVKNHMDMLGASISFTTELGKGSTFTFRIPLLSAVNIVDALVVEANKTIYAFPISNVIASISLSKKEINGFLKDGMMIKYLDHLLPLYNLDAVINKESEHKVEYKKDGSVNVLIIEHKTAQIAFIVSNFLAPQKLVIIPFDGSLSVTGLVGSTILGANKLGFIVDVPSLIDLVNNKEDSESEIPRVAETGIEDEKCKGDDQKVKSKVDQKAKIIEDNTPVVRKEDDNFKESFKENFILELEKLCSELNAAVFGLESNEEDQTQVNAAFRLFHTIKGNLIMMGLPKGGETVHSVETVLDLVRSEELDMTPDIVDIIMDGVTYIENIIHQSKSGTWTDQVSHDIVEKAGSILPETTYEQESIGDIASAEIKLTHESAYRSLMYRKQKKCFYRMYIEFNVESQPSFLVACLIYKRMCEVVDVLGTVPLLSDIEKGRMEGKMKLLFVSGHPFETLQKQLQDYMADHYGVSVMKLTHVVC